MAPPLLLFRLLKQFRMKLFLNKEVFMKRIDRPSSVSVALKQTISSLKSADSFKENSPSGYTVKLANTLAERQAAYSLAYRVYLDKGYVKENPNEWLVKKYDANSDTATLIVKNNAKKVIASVTMVFDGAHSIPAASLYRNEIKILRSYQEKIVEISRLVIDPDHRNAKEILVILFNYVYIFSYIVKKYSCLIIEVNPRHKEFYRSILRFDEIGAEKPNPLVQNAPAVLLYGPLKRGKDEVLKNLTQSIERKSLSLFPHFLKPAQEILVAAYLEKQNNPMTEEEKIFFGFTESGSYQAVCI